MKDYLTKHSLSLIEDIGNKEYLEHYIKPKNRGLTVMEIERAVLAAVRQEASYKTKRGTGSI